MVRTRSVAKKEHAVSDEPTNDSDEQESIVDEEESIAGEEIEYEARGSKRSPYKEAYGEVKKLLEDLKDNEIDVQVAGICRSYTVNKRITSRSRSTSASRRAKSKSTEHKRLIEETASFEEASPNCNRLLWLSLYSIVFALLAVASAVYVRDKPEIIEKLPFRIPTFLMNVFAETRRPTYQDVIREYKNESALPGISAAIIEAAIDRFHKEKAKNDEKDYPQPVVLMFYGPDEAKIRDFYLKLAETIIEANHTNASGTVFDVNYLTARSDSVKDNLKTNKVALFDGLEKLKSKDYMALYGFVDEGDASVKKCLIALSFHGELNKTEDIFYDTYLMENHVRKQLRARWKSVDVNNLEAFLNRLISFVSFVL